MTNELTEISNSVIPDENVTPNNISEHANLDNYDTQNSYHQSKNNENASKDQESNDLLEFPHFIDSIFSNSSLGQKLPELAKRNSGLSMALLKVELEYQEIRSLINIQKQKSMSYILNLDSGNSNQMILKDNINNCIPFKKTNFKIECNDKKSSCKCPEGYVPCSNSKVLAGYRFWKTAVDDICTGDTKDTALIVGKLFSMYACNGKQIDKSYKNDLKYYKDDSCKICEDADAILCRRIESLCESTQWSQWSGCSKPCGPGIQQRFRFFLNSECDGEYNKDTRNCQLAECPIRVPYSSCKLMTLSEKSKTNQVMYNSSIYGCYCPEGYISCSSEEALSNKESWIDDFINHKNNYIESLKSNGFVPEGLSDEYLNYLSSSYKILLRGGIMVDGSMNWSIPSNFNLYGLCQPGAQVLCRRAIDYEMTQAASFAQFVFKPKYDSVLGLSYMHYSIILIILGFVSLIAFILSKICHTRKWLNVQLFNKKNN